MTIITVSNHDVIFCFGVILAIYYTISVCGISVVVDPHNVDNTAAAPWVKLISTARLLIEVLLIGDTYYIVIQECTEITASPTLAMHT